MKRLLTILLCLLLCLALASCSGGGTAGEETRTMPETETEAPAEPETEAPTEAETEVPTVSAPIHGTDRTVSLPEGTLVWLSATGEKFHKVNDCGNMNPDKARQVTVEEAVAEGHDACENCYE